MIVVGVDHSAGAKEALRFALGEAQLRDPPLRVIHAWQFGHLGTAGIAGGLLQLAATERSFAMLPSRLWRRQSGRRFRTRGA